MKKLRVLTVRNIRELVNIVNDYNADPDHIEDPIQKEDVVSLIKGESQYHFIYFK